MNFYTENLSYNTTPNGGALQAMHQPKNDYPIMNQLLSGMSMNHLNQNMIAQKNFMCGICNNAFFKKKELDRHVLTIHTNLKQFKCEQCSKEFNRKDKLLRHEKTHLIPANIFNCSLCPAVFVRKQMLESHSKIHEMDNGDPIGNLLANLQSIMPESNGIINSSFTPEVVRRPMAEMVQTLAQEPPVASFYPMNLSVSKSLNEPMNLSNDKVPQISPTMKIERDVKIANNSDDENDNLQIVEDAPVIKKSPSFNNLYQNASEQTPMITDEQQQQHQQQHYSKAVPDLVPMFENSFKNSGDISFPMTSRIHELDKLEPLRDLPMEILNND